MQLSKKRNKIIGKSKTVFQNCSNLTKKSIIFACKYYYENYKCTNLAMFVKQSYKTFFQYLIITTTNKEKYYVIQTCLDIIFITKQRLKYSRCIITKTNFLEVLRDASGL